MVIIKIKKTIQEDIDDLSLSGLLREGVIKPSSYDKISRYKYFREYYRKDPISKKFGHAMFVTKDNLDSILGAYGDYLFVYDGSSSVDINKIKRMVWNDWRDDIENNNVSVVLHRGLLNMDRGEFFDSINPEDIVSDAGLWDSYPFVYWFWDRYNYPAVTLDEGAIVFDRNLIDRVDGDMDDIEDYLI